MAPFCMFNINASSKGEKQKYEQEEEEQREKERKGGNRNKPPHKYSKASNFKTGNYCADVLLCYFHDSANYTHAINTVNYNLIKPAKKFKCIPKTHKYKVVIGIVSILHKKLLFALNKNSTQILTIKTLYSKKTVGLIVIK